MSILQVNSCSIDQKSGEIWTAQTDLQQIYLKSDRLLVIRHYSADGILRQPCYGKTEMSDEIT